MTSPTAKPARLLASLIVLAGLLATVVAISAAAAATCPNHYCAGDDGSTASNYLGQSPQIYFGEIGTFWDDYGGQYGPCSVYTGDPRGTCFSQSAAQNADALWSANTGMGEIPYYFAGGATSQYASSFASPYCFGRDEGNKAVAWDVTIYAYFAKWARWPAIAIDIEGNGYDGWSNTTQAANRQVFNGIWDFVANKSSADSRCNTTPSGYTFQPIVFSSPGQWSYSFNNTQYGLIQYTPIWSSQHCCNGGYPGSYYPGGQYQTIQGFGNSLYDWSWQYDENPDYNIMYEPIYSPQFGGNWGQ